MSLLTYIGPLGNLRAVKCPAPGLPAPRSRGYSVTGAIDGSVAVQLLPTSLRAFTWAIPNCAPDDMSELVALWQGVYGPPPFYWYNPVAAMKNMMSPGAATPGVPGPWGAEGGWTPGVGATVDVTSPGLWVTAGGNTDSPLVPVMADHTYTFVVEGDAAQVASVVWLDATGAELSTSAMVYGAPRYAFSGEPPALAAAAAIRAGAGTWRRSQITETDAVITWRPGEGRNEVVILQVSEEYIDAWDEEGPEQVRSDVTVALQEV